MSLEDHHINIVITKWKTKHTILCYRAAPSMFCCFRKSPNTKVLSPNATGHKVQCPKTHT